MKHFSTLLNTLLAGALIFVLLSFGLPMVQARAASPTQTPPEAQVTCDAFRSLNVSGTAVVNVAPDRALIQLGVQSNGVTVTEVQNANSAAIQKVIKALRGLGIPDKDIATDVYIVEPIYEDYDSLYIKGYRINNVVAVTVREVGKTSSLIAAALQAGANQVVNVEFYTSELRKYRDQARELAMKAAAEKAAALAGAAGAKTGCVLSISENTWSYYNGWWYGRSQSLWTQNTVQNVPSGGGSGAGMEGEPVSLGMISIRAEVGVSYGLK